MNRKGKRMQTSQHEQREARLMSAYEISLVGKNCTRITIPLLSIEHIEAAAATLRELAEDLDHVAKDKGTKTIVRVMMSRSLVNQASKRLKGGIAYKGAR